jgi:hypothetical protein
MKESMCFQLIGSQYLLLNPIEVLSVEADRQVCHLTLVVRIVGNAYVLRA